MDQSVAGRERPSERVDPITSEVIRHSLLSISNQIDVNITRTAFSPLIYEYKDYAVGIVDAEGQLIAQSKGGIPLFVANALGVAIREGLDIHGRDGIAPGDVLFTNYAGTLGQHLNNVVMYTPVYIGPDGTELFGFMAVLVHWIDIGGRSVGSSSSSGSTEIFQEGIQYHAVRLMVRGEPCRDMYRMIEANTRFPRLLLGDIESQLSGCLAGRDMILRLIEKYGLETVRGAVAMMWDRAEAATRAAIGALPDGTYRASSFLDNDSIDLDRRIPVEAVVTVAGKEMTIDFTGVSPQVKGPVNSGIEGGAVAAARIAFKYLVAPDEPANEGCFRPLRIVIPDGTFLSASPTAPMGGYSRPLATVVDTVLKAMVTAAPRHVAAGHHGDFGIHSISGRHPATGELFVCNGTMHGGWGASYGHDGPGPFKTHIRRRHAEHSRRVAGSHVSIAHRGAEIPARHGRGGRIPRRAWRRKGDHRTRALLDPGLLRPDDLPPLGPPGRRRRRDPVRRAEPARQADRGRLQGPLPARRERSGAYLERRRWRLRRAASA